RHHAREEIEVRLECHRICNERGWLYGSRWVVPPGAKRRGRYLPKPLRRNWARTVGGCHHGEQSPLCVPGAPRSLPVCSRDGSRSRNRWHGHDPFGRATAPTTALCAASRLTTLT